LSLSADSPEALDLENIRPFIHVVAGALIDSSGRVLIAQRPAGKHLAGGWEFPGGKLEPGEERLPGLARELREELGIVVEQCRPLIRVRHAYPSRDVLLDVWVVKRYAGEPRGLDGQRLRWCAQHELASADLLPADEPIVAALRLPERLAQVSTPAYSIGAETSGEASSTGAASPTNAVSSTDAQGRLMGAFCSNTEGAVEAAAQGAQFLVICRKLPDDELSRLCAAVCVPVYGREITLERAWALGASGISEIPG